MLTLDNFNIKDKNGLKVGKRQVTFTVEISDTVKDADILALAILLRGYNSYGRSIELNEYLTLEERFLGIVNRISNSLDSNMVNLYMRELRGE